eukprot:scaffold57_cov254-Pinguiococcus_pyrenoidosus.AAC.15
MEKGRIACCQKKVCQNRPAILCWRFWTEGTWQVKAAERKRWYITSQCCALKRRRLGECAATTKAAATAARKMTCRDPRRVRGHRAKRDR